MPITLNNTQVVFNDSTVQSTAALPLTGGTLTGALTLPNNNGLTPNIISRGSTTTGLTLTDFNTVHYYSTSTEIDVLHIGTTMVEDAVYRVDWQSISGTARYNFDWWLEPNHTQYGGSITTAYNYNNTTSLWTWVTQGPYGYFYHDHFGGGDGYGGRGTAIIFNYRNAGKKIIYRGTDSASCAMGRSYWNDTTTQWTNIGSMHAQTCIWRAWVRRIG